MLVVSVHVCMLLHVLLELVPLHCLCVKGQGHPCQKRWTLLKATLWGWFYYAPWSTTNRLRKLALSFPAGGVGQLQALSISVSGGGDHSGCVSYVPVFKEGRAARSFAVLPHLSVWAGMCALGGALDTGRRV